MNTQSNILITGAAGFIGSSLITELNCRHHRNLFLADNFTGREKDQFISGKSFRKKIDSRELFDFLDNGEDRIDFVFHLGGKTAGKADFANQNLVYPQKLFLWCSSNNVPFIYASSAATYGSGESGYDDNEELITTLRPLSEYGKSKHEFDLWILNRKTNCSWAGLKIFNAFGANEYRKGQSASVAFKSFFDIRATGKAVLFGSSNEKYEPGEQLRDFIYIKDIVQVLYWFFERWQQPVDEFPSGIFNVGTGIGRSFNDVAVSLFHSMDIPQNIGYKPIPESVLKSYPGNMIADIDKLRHAGYSSGMWTLEDAIDDLVKNYLIPGKIF